MNFLDRNDEITRYLFKGHYSRPDDKKPDHIKIKKNGIAPMLSDQGIRETSVMKTNGDTLETVISIGKEHVAPLRGQELKALGRFSVELPINLQLAVEHDKIGHPSHSSIKKWLAMKEDWLEKANDLAEEINKNTNKTFHECQN